MKPKEFHNIPKPQSAPASNPIAEVGVAEVMRTSTAPEDVPCSCPGCFSFDF